MFQESMVETEDQKEKKDEPEDKIFVIRKGEGVGKIIMGRKVENRVIHYLKNLAGAIKIYVNYKPSKRFVQHLVKTVSDNTACVLVASKDEINYVRGGTVAIKTMTENDSQELRVATQYPYPNSLTFH